MSNFKAFMPAAVLLASGILAAGCVVPPEEDPVLIKLDELDRRVDSIERVVSNESLLQLAADLETLRGEVRELRGDTDALRHELERTEVRQRDQYLDLDQRLQSLERRTRTGEAQPATSPETALGPVSGAGAGAGAGAASAGDQRASYQAALELLRQGRYERAEAAFGQYLADFPEGELADNAQYWLAETHYVNREFETALAGFQRVLEDYPNSRKTPDAMLKSGFCLHELGRKDEAAATLEVVIEQYPDSTAARLANQRLDRIRAEAR